MIDAASTAMILALMLLLPLSALASRRLPIGTVVKYGAAWVTIFVILYLIITRFT